MLANANARSIPRLSLLKQTASHIDQGTRAGVPQPIHVVVKNSPFYLQLGLSNASSAGSGFSLDFRSCMVDVTLWYENERGPVEKQVEFVNTKPVDMILKVNERGNQATLELRVRVLSSQHSGSLFRVKVALLNPTSGRLLHPSLAILTEPIKVVSKREQPSKKKTPKRKRTLTDMLVETIGKIEETQAKQQKTIDSLTRQATAASSHLLTTASPYATPNFDFSGSLLAGSSLLHDSNLLEPVAAPSSSISTTSSTSSSLSHQNLLSSDVSTNSSSPLLSSSSSNSAELPSVTRFEKSFRQFLLVYNSLPLEERPMKIRRLIRNISAKETERLTEFIDMFSREGVRRATAWAGGNLFGDASAMPTCKCKSCPYQQELLAINGFYKDMFLGNDAPGAENLLGSF